MNKLYNTQSDFAIEIENFLKKVFDNSYYSALFNKKSVNSNLFFVTKYKKCAIITLAR